MAALVHFVKTDTTVRTTASTTAAELTNYTIAWADLTGAGFAAGDDVVVMVAVKNFNSGANNNSGFAVGFGTTFAGRVEVTSSIARMEPVAIGNGDQYGPWVDRRTLVVNENIYFRGDTTAGTASYDEFVCMILKLTGMASTDFLYAEATHSGNAPSSATDGVSTTTPAAGDWLLIGFTHWLVDSVGAARMNTLIHWGAASWSLRTGGVDAADERVNGIIAYKNLASATTVKMQYFNSDSGVNDVTDTAIFGLRLDMFEDHIGAHTTNTITHSVIDTFQDFAAFTNYVKTSTGPFVVMGLPRHHLVADLKRPYGRILIDTAEWPAAGANRLAVADNSVDADIAPFIFGYNATQAAATIDIELECAEDTDVAPTYVCDVQVAVAFSLTLASAGPTASLLMPQISPSVMSMLVR